MIEEKHLQVRFHTIKNDAKCNFEIFQYSVKIIKKFDFSCKFSKYIYILERKMKSLRLNNFQLLKTGFFCFCIRTDVSRVARVLPRGLGIILMMKIENLIFLLRNLIFSSFAKRYPVGPKVELSKKS